MSPKSSRNFNKALQYLIEHQGKEFDLILYIGSIPSLYTGLIRIPERFEPKRFNFMDVYWILKVSITLFGFTSLGY